MLTWAVVLGLVTVNLITYLPLIQQGTACILPLKILCSEFINEYLKDSYHIIIFKSSHLEFSFLRSFSVMAQSPLSLKTTIPRCLAAGISNLVSDLTMASNFCSK